MAKRILVVEDNDLNRKLFCDVLKSQGYAVEPCADGLEALDRARQFVPNLIIMDIQLPEVSGLDLTRWIKDDSQINQIPIMAVTAFAMRQDERLVREAGCEAYMSKPIQMTAFINEVKKLTGPRGAGQPPRNATSPPTRRVAR